MKFTKFDLLIVLFVLIVAYVGINQARFFRVSGDNIFGTVMTHRSLVKRGYQSNVSVKGVDLQDFETKDIEGYIIDTEPDKIFLGSEDKTWVLFAHEGDKDTIENFDESEYNLMRATTIYLEPTKSFNITDECREDSYMSGEFYYRLEEPANVVTCDYLRSKLLERYGGRVRCSYAGNEVMLKTDWMKFDGDLGDILEPRENAVVDMEPVTRRCRTYVEG